MLDPGQTKIILKRPYGGMQTLQPQKLVPLTGVKVQILLGLLSDTGERRPFKALASLVAVSLQNNVRD